MADGADVVWNGAMPEAYERWLVPTLFKPFARDLAARAASGGGPKAARVLELAAGTGALTAELVGALPGASVTATDLNPAMVARGQAKVPSASWERADALELAFEDGSFDLVACQFGVMFLPDKAAAFAEARRVPAPGGRLLVSTWGRVDEHAFDAALQAALLEVFPLDPPRFMAEVPHGYPDPDRLRADLQAGGLVVRSVERVALDGRAPSAADVAAGFCLGTPVRAAIEARGADLAATADAVALVMAARLGQGEVIGRMVAFVAEAVAPG